MAGIEDNVPLTDIHQTGRQRAHARWVTIEPVLILGMLSYNSVGLLKPLYVKEAIQRHYNYTNENDTDKCGVANHSSLEDTIQAEASMWLLYLDLAAGIPAMISSIIFSTLSDRLGRKIVMAIPITGFALQSAVYFFTVHFDLPLAVLLVGEMIQGISGNLGLLFAVCLSYLAEATSSEKRTIRIIVAEMLNNLIQGLNQVGQGYLIKISYLPTLGITFSCCLLALLYLAIPSVLIETVDRKFLKRRRIRDVFQSMKKLMEFNDNGRRWQMILLDLFIFFYVCETAGTGAIYVLYGTAKPFCWTSATAGIANAISWVSTSLGMLFGAKLFSFCVGDYWLMQISCISILTKYMVIGFAKSTAVIYVGTILGCFRGMALSASRSVLSKITHPDETGAMFSIVGCMETIAILASGAVANKLYASTLRFLPPLTLFAYAGAVIIPAGITVALQILWPQCKQFTPLVEVQPEQDDSEEQIKKENDIN